MKINGGKEMAEMKEVFILTGMRNGKMEILSVNATAKGSDKELESYFGEGSVYSDPRIEAWVIGE